MPTDEPRDEEEQAQEHLESEATRPSTEADEAEQAETAAHAEAEAEEPEAEADQEAARKEL